MQGPPPPWFFLALFPVLAASAGIVIPQHQQRESREPPRRGSRAQLAIPAPDPLRGRRCRPSSTSCETRRWSGSRRRRSRSTRNCSPAPPPRAPHSPARRGRHRSTRGGRQRSAVASFRSVLRASTGGSAVFFLHRGSISSSPGIGIDIRGARHRVGPRQRLPPSPERPPADRAARRPARSAPAGRGGGAAHASGAPRRHRDLLRAAQRPGPPERVAARPAAADPRAAGRLSPFSVPPRNSLWQVATTALTCSR